MGIPAPNLECVENKSDTKRVKIKSISKPNRNLSILFENFLNDFLSIKIYSYKNDTKRQTLNNFTKKEGYNRQSHNDNGKQTRNYDAHS